MLLCLLKTSNMMETQKYRFLSVMQILSIRDKIKHAVLCQALSLHSL